MQLEQNLSEEVDRIVQSGVSADDVERASALICTDLAVSMQSASDRADKLSMFATYFRKPELINEQIAKYQSVTVEEVESFIKSSLTQDNRALLLFLPRTEAVQ